MNPFSALLHLFLSKTFWTFKHSVLILNPIFIGFRLFPVVEFPVHLALITAEITFLLVIEITNWAFRLYWVSKLLSFIDLRPDRYLIGWNVFLNSNRLIGIFQTLITTKTNFLFILTLKNLNFVGLTKVFRLTVYHGIFSFDPSGVSWHAQENLIFIIQLLSKPFTAFKSIFVAVSHLFFIEVPNTLETFWQVFSELSFM